MGRIIFPAAEAGINVAAPQPYYPGQINLRSAITGSVQTLNRGYGSWRGIAAISLLGYYDEARAKKIESFFAALEGQQNYTDIPLQRPTPSAGSATVTAINVDSEGKLLHTLNTSLAVETGDWLSSSGRVFIVREVNGQVLVLDPQRPLGSNATISPAPTIRVKNDADIIPPTRRTYDNWGPWTFNWVEFTL